MRPPPLVISILTQLSKIIPTWKLIPTNDIIDLAFKVPEVRQAVYFFFPYLNFITDDHKYSLIDNHTHLRC